jgi:hypothetical protein
MDFGDLIPADCVFRRLSKELFALAFLAISTWRLLRDHMASEGSSWHESGLKSCRAGSPIKEDGDNSSDETPSVSGSSKGDGPEKLWIARSYFSIMDEEGLKSTGIDIRSLMTSFLGSLIRTRRLARPSMMMWLFMKPISMLG